LQVEKKNIVTYPLSNSRFVIAAWLVVGGNLL